ncbi:Ig-like domain-containing protein, partial [Yersinia enterocolitica]|uniref:Ig-like domain-containing protein n=1 Tax=Yersinia enterocolitica TaxID=630 RepID=UPI003AB81097
RHPGGSDLPAYPQLGGKLMYEQYRGEEVALFGKNNRQNNPHAVTAGVNYTPIPLLTVGAEHRAGKGGKNDSSINLQLTYRPGTSWQSHIDPSAVAGSRTLAGSRHDLVERNNDIVLDYQKQELVRVTLPAHVKGEAGATTTVTAQVNSKYALSRIEWDSASLVAAGGTLTSVSPQAVAVRLPVYVATNNSNSYVHTLGAIAYDTQGNTSSRVTLQMTVLPSTASAPQLTVTTDNAVANGSAVNAVQALVTDANGNPLADQVVSFRANNNATITAVTGTTGTDGIATATLTNTTVGTSVVTATLSNSASATVNTTFVADAGTATIADGDFTVTTDNAVANGSATNAVQAIVTDMNSNLLAEQTVTFSVSNGATVTTVIGTTGADGVATATLTNITAGISTVTATLSNSASATVNTTFVADAGTATIADGDFTVTTDNAVANGSAVNALSATVKDAEGNTVPDVYVTFTVTSGSATPASQNV